jgi:cyclic dehypoxanthinyl futalosine synthase
VQAGWTGQGLKVLQTGLRFGANDLGAAGPGSSEEDLRRVIRDAGFRPVQRDSPYRTMFLN